MRLSRDVIRNRLARPFAPRVVGDVQTAMSLMARDDLQPYDANAFGPLPSTGIPYDQAPGAPGARVKRTPAAVLAGLIERKDGFSLLLTTRTGELKRHAGQVAFPGGRRDPADVDMVACALREAEEEVAMPRAQVEIVGQLPIYTTITGYDVTPIVGVITPPVDLRPDPVEVADIFEVPLAFLLDRANHRREQREVKGLKRAFYAMVYDGHYIWGATAGMILNLVDALSADETLRESA